MNWQWWKSQEKEQNKFKGNIVKALRAFHFTNAYVLNIYFHQFQVTIVWYLLSFQSIVFFDLVNQPVDNTGRIVHHVKPDSEYAYLWKRIKNRIETNIKIEMQSKRIILNKFNIKIKLS